MLRRISEYFRSTEGIALLTTVVLVAGVTLVNPTFLSIGNLLDLIRNSITNGMLALGVFLVLLSGGIDVSFTAIAATVMYSVTKFFNLAYPSTPLVFPLLAGALLGALLGAVNGSLIAFFRLPTLIVTLGTLSLFRGFLLTFVGTANLDPPDALVDLSRVTLYRGTLADGSVFRLPATVLALVGVAVVVGFLLRFTVLGRNVRALGGSETASERLGIPVVGTKLFIYVLVGTIAGFTGVIHSAQARVANPFDLVGTELNVLAAVVLGGARISGGRGSVFGTLVGVFLVTTINNSLVLMRISTSWQRCAVGLLIIAGAGLPLLLRRLRRDGG